MKVVFHPYLSMAMVMRVVNEAAQARERNRAWVERRKRKNFTCAQDQRPVS